jgi:hypothetical protein
VTQAAAQAPAPIVLNGEVSNVSGSCPNLTFSISGTLVRTNGATAFADRCQRVRERRDFTVTGVVQGDGSVLALIVREDD